MPLLFPIALPGMASAVDTLCVLVAFGLSRGQSVPLPKWLANRVLSARVKAMLTSMIHRALAILARMGRPRMLCIQRTDAGHCGADHRRTCPVDLI